jgi:hypothetical protein
MACRLSPPWSVEELDACFVVKDRSGQKLGYFYYEAGHLGHVPVEEPSTASKADTPKMDCRPLGRE